MNSNIDEHTKRVMFCINAMYDSEILAKAGLIEQTERQRELLFYTLLCNCVALTNTLKEAAKDKSFSEDEINMIIEQVAERRNSTN